LNTQTQNKRKVGKLRNEIHDKIDKIEVQIAKEEVKNKNLQNQIQKAQNPTIKAQIEDESNQLAQLNTDLITIKDKSNLKNHKFTQLTKVRASTKAEEKSKFLFTPYNTIVQLPG